MTGTAARKAPARGPLAASNGHRARDLSGEKHGVKRELAGGGWVIVRARGSIDMLRKLQQLEAGYRKEHDLALDAPIPRIDALTLSLGAMVGTTLIAWGDFSDGSEPLAFNDENGVFLLTEAGSATVEILAEIDRLDALQKRNVEVAEGNLPPASDGSSATGPTPAS